MIIFNPKTKWFSLTGLWKEFWSVVWNLAEYFHVDLCRFAPWVFGQMIGCKKKEMPKQNNLKSNKKDNAMFMKILVVINFLCAIFCIGAVFYFKDIWLVCCYIANVTTCSFNIKYNLD